MKVILIEDDPVTADLMREGLEAAGHVVLVSRLGAVGDTAARTGAWDLLIVDRLLPDIDGLTLVKRLRSASIDMPVIFTTTLDSVADRVEGLEGGGDDYLVKPFAMEELIARVGVIGRRHVKADPEIVLQLADLRLDLIARTVHRDVHEIRLQPRQFQLLEFFLRNAERIVTRRMLLERIFGYNFMPKTNIVDSHV